MRHTGPTVPQVQIIAFRVGPEEFGLNVFDVHEILRHQKVTPVPRAPAFMEGVIDVRGTLVPVVDLRRRFELSATEVADQTRIVVTEHVGERLGLVVDSVSEVLRVPETAVSKPPAYVRGLAAEYVQGMVRVEERLIVLLDIGRILSSEERIALEHTELDTATPAGTSAEQA